MKKIIAVILSFSLVLGFTITAYAHNWPEDVDDWSDEDWDAWYDYWDDEDEDWEEYTDWGDNKAYEDYDWIWNPDWYKEYFNRNYNNNYGKVKEKPYGNITNNYGNYNFYAGILDVYDSSTEDQATVLARIINIYAHGTKSQTTQACVGWAVMNSVDISPRGTTICDVAPNFSYDYSGAITDDFGRNLKPLARDIIFRWKAGRSGINNNGRVMPSNYCYVWSNGSTVTFYTTPNGSGTPWNYSAVSPYGN